MVLKLLSDDQKAQRMQVCEDTLQNIENDPELLIKVIMGYKTWVFEYDPQMKQWSKQWLSFGLPRPKKAHQSRSQKLLIDSLIQSNGCDRAAEDAVFKLVSQREFNEAIRTAIMAIYCKHIV